MKKTTAKQLFKKAEELRTILMEEYWRLNKIQSKTKKDKEDSKLIDFMLTRINAIEGEVEDIVRPKGTMTWSEFDKVMCKANDANNHIIGVIVYKASNFKKQYQSLEERSYKVSSDNKVFQAGAGGYSLFGSNLARTDLGVRLERIGWAIEYCYLVEKD